MAPRFGARATERDGKTVREVDLCVHVCVRWGLGLGWGSGEITAPCPQGDSCRQLDIKVWPGNKKLKASREVRRAGERRQPKMRPELCNLKAGGGTDMEEGFFFLIEEVTCFHVDVNDPVERGKVAT